MEVLKAIESLQGKITMIVVAHRLSTLQGCRQICRLGNTELTQTRNFRENA